MAAARDYDLTTGSIAGHFRRLAIPAALGMLFTTLYNVVDVYFAGQIGTDAQAGLAIGFQAFFVLLQWRLACRLRCLLWLVTRAARKMIAWRAVLLCKV